MKIRDIINEFKAYHGSSRKFDQFSLDKILSGEGNVSYGYGVYIAEHPATGKHYAMVAHEANKARIASKKGELSAIEWKLAKVPVRGQPILPPQERGQLIKDKHRLEKEIKDFEAGLAKHFFQLEVNDSIVPYLLNLDKQLGDQNPEVKDALTRIGVDTSQPVTGFKLLKQLERDIGVEGATKKLQSAGISGTKYLDALSRGKGAGSHNYVIFDPENIKIKKVTTV